MFHAGLRGYFPGRSFERVMALDPAKVRAPSCRCSTAELELRVRRELSRATKSCSPARLQLSALIVGDAEQQASARWTEIGGGAIALGVSATRCSGARRLRGAASIALDRLCARLRVARARLLARCERLGRRRVRPPTPALQGRLALIAGSTAGQDVFALVADEHKIARLDHYARSQPSPPRPGLWSIKARRIDCAATASFACLSPVAKFPGGAPSPREVGLRPAPSSITNRRWVGVGAKLRDRVGVTDVPRSRCA